MDIISHGLWGGVALGRKTKKSFWLSFIFGIAPDFFSFGLYTSGVLLGIIDHPSLSSGEHPSPDMIPAYVHDLYNITHSLVIFLLVFLIVYLLLGRPVWEMLAWPLHIIFDIFTHGSDFFPTPFLWPISDYYFEGHSWATPEILIPNLIFLLAIYSYWFYAYWRKKPRIKFKKFQI